MTTRADLQRLYDECTRSDPRRVYYRDDCVGDLVTALGDFLAGDDPSVEIAYLKATLADVEAERERLERWKAEALPVMSGLQELGEALGVRPGERITGHSSAEAARALRARAEAAEQILTQVRKLHSEREAGPLEGYCRSCGYAGPCPTTRVLDGGA